MPMKAAVVITTINVPILLEGYRDNFERYGHLDEVTVYLIPDRKTPRDANYWVESLRRNGLHIIFPDIGEQDTFLDKLGLPTYFVPYDSDNRRNIGYLMALRDGAEFVVSLDDDNYCVDDTDFLDHHSIVCDPPVEWEVETPRHNWMVPTDLVKGITDTFPRGFPYFARNGFKQVEVGDFTSHKKLPIVANQGMWKGSPDLNAMDHLHRLYCGIELTIPRQMIANLNAWAPINSQNTSVSRACLPAYYFLRSPRFGDIYQGYFLLACLKQLGWTVRYGTPIVDHRRNAHDYLHDAELELPDIRALEEFLPKLIEHKLEGSTISDAYASLIPFVAFNLSLEKANRMTQWLKACATIGV